MHLPALCGPDGAWAATRFELTARPEPGMPGIGFTHVTILELDDADVVAQAARDPRGRRRAAARGRMHPAHASIAADAFVAHGPHGAKARAVRARAPGTSSPTCSAPIRPRRRVGRAGTTTCTCPTCSRAARSRRCRGGAASRRSAVGPNHLTLYDVATPTVEEAVGAIGGDARRRGRRRPQARVPHRRADRHAAPDRSPRRRRVLPTDWITYTTHGRLDPDHA